MKLKHILSNPEFGLVLLSPSELRFYIGDNQQLELIEAREVEPTNLTPRLFNGLKNVISHRQQAALKAFALHLLHMPRIARVAVVVSGDPSLVEAFARFFAHPHGVVVHPSEAMITMTCPEILQEAWAFRPSVTEIYMGHFRERLRQLMRQGRLVADAEGIHEAVRAGEVVRLLIAETPRKDSVESELAESVINDGGEFQIIPRELFPVGVSILAVLRGVEHAHTPLLALDA